MSLTVKDIEAARDAMLNAPRREMCPPHVVHPRYLTDAWRLADGASPPKDTDRAVGCANLCGAFLWFERVSKVAE